MAEAGELETGGLSVGPARPGIRSSLTGRRDLEGEPNELRLGCGSTRRISRSSWTRFTSIQKVELRTWATGTGIQLLRQGHLRRIARRF